MDKNIQELLNMDFGDVEIENSKEIEFEINEWTSLLYDIDEDVYYAYHLDTYDEEEYKAPIYIEDDDDLLFDITVEDKHNFKDLIEELKSKGELK